VTTGHKTDASAPGRSSKEPCGKDTDKEVRRFSSLLPGQVENGESSDLRSTIGMDNHFNRLWTVILHAVAARQHAQRFTAARAQRQATGLGFIERPENCEVEVLADLFPESPAVRSE
jgi:hypothetical protein